MFRFGDFALDAGRRELTRGGVQVAVEPQVFDLLLYLIQNRDRVVSKDDLLEAVWGGRIVSESTLTSRINAARSAIGDSGARQEMIRTIARKGFRFVGHVVEEAAADTELRPPPVPPDRPSIAVLPFTNLSGDPEQSYFIDGIAEEIIIALSRLRWFFVIARQSSFAYRDKGMDAKQIACELGVRYVLMGSVRRSGDRIRVSAQLIEGGSGSNVWGRSFDRTVSDVFAVQDEITQTIVGAIEPELGRIERERARIKPRESLDAWSLYQHGMFHLYRCTREDLIEARRYFQKAVAIDAEFGPAYSGEAETYYYEVVYGFAASNDANRVKAIGPARRAVTLDAEDAGAHCTLGRIHYLRREYPQAISELTTALALNPSLALAHYGLGAALVFSGRPEEAIPHLESAIRLSPHDPVMGSFLVRLADVRYFLADYEGAVAYALKALGQPSFQWSRYTVLIAALGQLGRPDEAQRYLAELTRERPDFSIAFVRKTHLFGRPEAMDRYCEGLRKAGVPDTVLSGDSPPAPRLVPPKQEIRYCMAADGVRLAYSIIGKGPPLVRAAHWLSHLEYEWQSPVWTHVLQALSAENLLVRYDERGSGLSDWNVDDISFEAFVRDLESVVDASGLERFALFGMSQGSAVSIAYTVRHPERVTRLVLLGGFARGRRKRGSQKEIDEANALDALMRLGWGQENPAFRQVFTSLFIPDGSSRQMQWLNDLQRNTTSPENAVRIRAATGGIDVTHLLPQVRVPTLVFHCRGDAAVSLEEGRILAGGIPGARLVVLEGRNHLMLEGEPAWGHFLDEMRNFLRPEGRGAQASEPARIRRAAAAPPAVVERIRRQVSALAVEIVSPFQDMEAEDPEAGAAVVGPLMQAARREVELCGGIVLSCSDASLVGLFGAGRATEDHALQACRAALAIKAAAESGGQAHVRLSVALDSGEAVLRPVAAGGTQQVETEGAVVRTARQLAQGLRRQAIVCTRRMNDTLAGHVAVAATTDADFSVPPAGQCFEILGRRNVDTRWQLRRLRGLMPLTGRADELRYLHEVWGRVRSGSGQCVGIVGDAGVGKSRLVHELLTSAEAAAEGRIVHIGALESDAVASFHLVKKLLRAIFSVEHTDDPSATAAKVAAHLAALGADPGLRSPVLFALDISPDDREWATLPASERVRRLMNAVSTLLAQAAKARPLIVVVEDLHWIDAESQSALDRLISGIATQRLMLLLTFRPGCDHPWGSSGCYSQLRLDPLPRDAAEALLGVLLGDDASVQPLIGRIAEHTDGMPLFIEESVQALAQAGALTGDPGAYAASGEIARLPVPATVQSVIAARIDGLEPGDRWLLQNAAVIGRNVSIATIAAIGGLEEEAAAERLLKLQKSGFLYETQIFPTRVFTFKHALVQQVAYDSLVTADRKRLHGRLIDILEAAPQHPIDDHVEKLAEHAISAERWDKAEGYLLRSAERALQRSSHNLAISFLERGLEVLTKRDASPDRDRLELEYQKLLGVAWMAARGWGADQVLAAYERAEVLCNALGDETERFIALRGQAQYYMISGQPRAAQTISERCADMTKRQDDAGIVIETHHMFWTNNFFMGKCGAAEEHAEEAVALYDPDRHHALTYKYSGHDPGVCSRCFSGLSAWQRGALDAAVERCDAARALAERLAHPLTSALAYWGLAYLGMLRPDPEAALAWAQKEIALCDDYLLPLLRSQGEFQAGWALAQLGDLQAGIAQMECGVEGIRATGAWMGLPYFEGLLGEALANTGQSSRAIHVVDRAIASARESGSHFLLSEIVRTKAQIVSRMKGGDAREAEALFRSAVEIATGQNAPLPALRAAIAWARFLRERRQAARARAVLRPHAQLIASLAGSPEAEAAAQLA